MKSGGDTEDGRVLLTARRCLVTAQLRSVMHHTHCRDAWMYADKGVKGRKVGAL